MTRRADSQIVKNQRLPIIDRIAEPCIFATRIWLEIMHFFYAIIVNIMCRIDRRRLWLLHSVITGSRANPNIWKVNRYNITIIFKDLLYGRCGSCGRCGRCVSCCGHYSLVVGLLACWLAGLLACWLAGLLVVGLALNLFGGQLIFLFVSSIFIE